MVNLNRRFCQQTSSKKTSRKTWMGWNFIGEKSLMVEGFSMEKVSR